MKIFFFSNFVQIYIAPKEYHQNIYLIIFFPIKLRKITLIFYLVTKLPTIYRTLYRATRIGKVHTNVDILSAFYV